MARSPESRRYDSESRVPLAVAAVTAVIIIMIMIMIIGDHRVTTESLDDQT